MRKKPIIINGERYSSIADAAMYIAHKEERSTGTIARELRKLWHGRAPWRLYGKYLAMTPQMWRDTVYEYEQEGVVLVVDKLYR